jgi:hypothetical protein
MYQDLLQNYARIRQRLESRRSLISEEELLQKLSANKRTMDALATAVDLLRHQIHEQEVSLTGFVLVTERAASSSRVGVA